MFSFFCKPFAFLFRHRKLLKQTVITDIKSRVTGSVLGIAWVALQPMLFLMIYSLVYGLIFKVRFQLFDTSEYIVVIFCGLIPFLGIAEALGTGVSCVSSNSTLIKNTLFPIDLIPVKTVLAGQMSQVVGTGLLLLAVLFVGHMSPWALLLPVLWTMQLMFMVGIIWILSSMNVYLRDLQYLIGTLILLLMMISPIAYTTEMIPENWRIFIWFNPLSHMILSYQDILMMGRFPGAHFWVFLCISIFFFYTGFYFFQKMKLIFVDNI